MSRHDHLDRAFEGRAVLQTLLTASGSLADVEDVAEAFRAALKDAVPAPVVIQALWDDEPRFGSGEEAARLFSNLLGLYELLAEGKAVDLSAPGARVRREKATRPEPFGAEGPDEAFVEAAWRYLDDFPRERERFEHAFDNRQDALVSWLDASGLDDAGFGAARQVLGEVFALLELGGRTVASLDEGRVPPTPEAAALPPALAAWLDDALAETEAADAEAVRDVVQRATVALWRAAKA